MPVNLVYDCGTYYAKDQPVLLREIDHCFPSLPGEKREIDMLFISHLDRDHISGIPYLLRTYPVKNVFLPDVSPEELILFSAVLDDDNQDLLAFYSNPVVYLQEHGCQNIFLSRPDRGRRGLGQDWFRSETNIFTFTGDIEERQDAHSGSQRVYSCYGTVYMNEFRHRWHFEIYQDQSPAVQRKIQTQIRALVPNGDLTQILRDPSIQKRAKEVYKTILKDINQSSLVLYHAPAEEDFCVSFSMNPWTCDYRRGRGTLLTGDLNLTRLRDNGEHFTRFTGMKAEKLAIIQLPHHGSGKSISIHQLAKITVPQQTLFVCCYSRGNQFRHPDPYMLDKLLLQCQCFTRHVVTNENFSYFVWKKP